MQKKVVIIHTSFVSLDHLNSLFAQTIPEAEVHHIVDDTLLADVIAHQGVTKDVMHKYCLHALAAETCNADLIFNQCSSVGACADTAAGMLHTPILKVDQEMADQAAAIGGKIAVVATLGTTLTPSIQLIESAVKQAGKPAEIVPVLVDGAFQKLSQPGGRAVHDQMVIDAITKVAPDVNVITLAQGSMALLLDAIGDVGVPVLASPELGVKRARKELGL